MITMTCESCGDILECDVESPAVLRDKAARAGWTIAGYTGPKNKCPDCLRRIEEVSARFVAENPDHPWVKFLT